MGKILLGLMVVVAIVVCSALYINRDKTEIVGNVKVLETDENDKQTTSSLVIVKINDSMYLDFSGVHISVKESSLLEILEDNVIARMATGKSFVYKSKYYKDGSIMFNRYKNGLEIRPILAEIEIPRIKINNAQISELQVLLKVASTAEMEKERNNRYAIASNK